MQRLCSIICSGRERFDSIRLRTGSERFDSIRLLFRAGSERFDSERFAFDCRLLAIRKFTDKAMLDLRLCMFQRLWSYGLTSMHVRAPAVIWTYVSECRSAGGHMELRLCMFERRRGLNTKRHVFDIDLDLRLCMFRRQWQSGLTFMQI